MEADKHMMSETSRKKTRHIEQDTETKNVIVLDRAVGEGLFEEGTK